MPNILQKEVRGRPIYYVPIILFVDDASGTTSKQWNKHFVCYMSNASLPREHIDKEFNIRFVGSSPHLGLLDLLQGIHESFR